MTGRLIAGAASPLAYLHATTGSIRYPTWEEFLNSPQRPRLTLSLALAGCVSRVLLDERAHAEDQLLARDPYLANAVHQASDLVGARCGMSRAALVRTVHGNRWVDLPQLDRILADPACQQRFRKTWGEWSDLLHHESKVILDDGLSLTPATVEDMENPTALEQRVLRDMTQLVYDQDRGHITPPAPGVRNWRNILHYANNDNGVEAETEPEVIEGMVRSRVTAASQLSKFGGSIADLVREVLDDGQAYRPSQVVRAAQERARQLIAEQGLEPVPLLRQDVTNGLGYLKGRGEVQVDTHGYYSKVPMR